MDKSSIDKNKKLKYDLNPMRKKIVIEWNAK